MIITKKKIWMTSSSTTMLIGSSHLGFKCTSDIIIKDGADWSTLLLELGGDWAAWEAWLYWAVSDWPTESLQTDDSTASQMQRIHKRNIE